jgi:hypothetical protein
LLRAWKFPDIAIHSAAETNYVTNRAIMEINQLRQPKSVITINWSIAKNNSATDIHIF